MWINFETQSLDSLKGERLLVGARGLPSSHIRPVTFAPKFPLHAVRVFVGFAGVFRTNLSWARYWNAVTRMHFMHSKWSDLFSQVCFSPQKPWRTLWSRAPTSGPGGMHRRGATIGMPGSQFWQSGKLRTRLRHERNAVRAFAR